MRDKAYTDDQKNADEVNSEEGFGVAWKWRCDNGFERGAYNTFCDLLETHSKFQTVKYEHQKKLAFGGEK